MFLGDIAVVGEAAAGKTFLIKRSLFDSVPSDDSEYVYKGREFKNSIEKSMQKNLIFCEVAASFLSETCQVNLREALERAESACIVVNVYTLSKDFKVEDNIALWETRITDIANDLKRKIPIIIAVTQADKGIYNEQQKTELEAQKTKLNAETAEILQEINEKNTTLTTLNSENPQPNLNTVISAEESSKNTKKDQLASELEALEKKHLALKKQIVQITEKIELQSVIPRRIEAIRSIITRTDSKLKYAYITGAQDKNYQTYRLGVEAADDEVLQEIDGKRKSIFEDYKEQQEQKRSQKTQSPNRKPGRKQSSLKKESISEKQTYQVIYDAEKEQRSLIEYVRSFKQDLIQNNNPSQQFIIQIIAIDHPNETTDYSSQDADLRLLIAENEFQDAYVLNLIDQTSSFTRKLGKNIT
jgi:hypothetical protein